MYNWRKGSWFKHLDFIILDIILLQLAFVVSYVLRHGYVNPYEQSIYKSISILMVFMDLCIVFFQGSYKGIVRRGYFAEFKAILKHISSLIALLFAFMFIMQNSESYSRIVFVEMWFIGTAFLFIGRSLLKKKVQSTLKVKKEKRFVYLVTTIERARDIVETIYNIEHRDYRIRGIILIGNQKPISKIREIPVVATEDKALEYLKSSIVDEVFVDVPFVEQSVREILDGCVLMGITIHLALQQVHMFEGDKVLQEFAGRMVMTSSVKNVSAKQVFYKRTMDVVGSLVGLLITGILFVFVAPIIFIQSPGPILFSQWRVGINGRKFRIYKFRSMYKDAEERKKELMDQNEMKGNMFKMKNDPRIFPFGKIMRKYSIDEFPQFWNVLKGDMSLVGTRPPTVEEWEKYELHHRKRLSIKPGLTGLWQISGRSDIVDFEEVVKLDTMYIVGWSMGNDIKILLKTVGVVFGEKGAV